MNLCDTRAHKTCVLSTYFLNVAAVQATNDFIHNRKEIKSLSRRQRSHSDN